VSRSWLLYLDDLIESAEKIGRLVAGRTFATFCSDEASFDAVLFNLQIIGEAIKRFPEDARAAMPDAISSGPAKMRDLIAHHYFALDPEIIWEVATTHVPVLLIDARAVRNRAEGESADTET
jgi:uncharacterized protein with HEPN domain